MRSKFKPPGRLNGQWRFTIERERDYTVESFIQTLNFKEKAAENRENGNFVRLVSLSGHVGREFGLRTSEKRPTNSEFA